MVDPTNQSGERIEESSETTMQPRWAQRFLIFLISLAALGGFAMVIVYSFDRGKQVGAVDQVPIIIAEEGPTRVKPDDPGGMKIPFRDKEVYGEFNPSEKAVKEPRLLPPEEKLISGLSPPNHMNEDSNEKVPNVLLGETLPQEKKVEKLWENPPRKMSVTSSYQRKKEKGPQQKTSSIKLVPEDRANRQKIQKEKQKRKSSGRKPLSLGNPKKPDSNKKNKESSKERSGYKIQIASFRSKASAERAWRRISRSNKDIFTQLKPSIVKAQIKNLGTWYRLQALPIKDLRSARAVCAELKKRKIGCLVAER